MGTPVCCREMNDKVHCSSDEILHTSSSAVSKSLVHSLRRQQRACVPHLPLLYCTLFLPCGYGDCGCSLVLSKELLSGDEGAPSLTSHIGK